MKKRNLVFVVLLFVIAAMVGGCTQSGTGDLSVSIESAELISASGFGISQVLITARNAGVVLNASIDFASGQTACDFQSVLSGIWTVEANGMDSSGKAVYYGKATVVVESGTSAAANLKLLPINGEYEMSIDLSDVDPAKVASAEIWVYPFGIGSYTKKHVITGEINKVHTVSATGIKPQSYEFQIRLFDISGESYYLSPWYTFDILPASKTYVLAGLEYATFTVGISLEDMPERPTIGSVTASEAGGTLNIDMSWTQPCAGELESAIVYVRFYETERYDSVHVYMPAIMEETVTGVQFSIDSDDFLSSGKMWLKIVTVGKNSMRSFSSGEVEYQP